MNKTLLKIKSAFLLLVFTCSVFSNSLFHHHEDGYDHSHHHHHSESICKTLDSNFYSPISCNHDSHFEFEEEGCFWCDKYNSPSYNFFKNYISNNVFIIKTICFQLESSYRFYSYKNLTNKGPPIFFT